MGIGRRIHFFRKHRSMTQQELGAAVGFPAAAASVRIAQYETGERKPKATFPVPWMIDQTHTGVLKGGVVYAECAGEGVG